MKKLSIFALGLILVGFQNNAFAQITNQEFYQLRDVFYKEFHQDLIDASSLLTINPPLSENAPNYWLDLDVRHASYSTFINEAGIRQHYLFVFGGLARFPKTTKDAVALTLCHELGHGLGGAPFKDKGTNEPLVSIEAQSDYFAAAKCLPRILPLIASPKVAAPDSYTQSLCQKQFQHEDEMQLCYRFFQALEIEREFYRTQPGIQQETHYETPDATIVDQIDLSPSFYPSAQCRLDTFVAGYFKKSPPRCWFAP